MEPVTGRHMLVKPPQSLRIFGEVVFLQYLEFHDQFVTAESGDCVPHNASLHYLRVLWQIVLGIWSMGFQHRSFDQ